MDQDVLQSWRDQGILKMIFGVLDLTNGGLGAPKVEILGVVGRS